ncbi:MAG: isoprenylcysteine carboxylmethyltransferase family protein [Candidatus Eremiobacteraeota bacterium]|nr:isoprenylcysteine carboxylmethyltransferase family protein [Candidatus Eremiobacteraeota bacterium]
MPLPKPGRLVANILGAALLASGAAYGPGAAVRMLAMKTSIDPYRPTTAIIESGPFRFSRNPLYVSMAMFYAAIALFARATLPLALLPAVLAVVQRGVICREERYLERKFGTAYLAYKSRVRRWL